MAANGGGHIIGRACERAALDRALRAAARGRPTVVLVDGDGGAGKTSLVRAVLREVPAPPVVRAGPAWGGAATTRGGRNGARGVAPEGPGEG